MAGVETSRHDDHSYRKLVAAQRALRLPCWLCGQRINYDSPDPNADDAFSYDHAKPWSLYPALRYDPDNGRSAHQLCNKARGNRDPNAGIGISSETW